MYWTHPRLKRYESEHNDMLRWVGSPEALSGNALSLHRQSVQDLIRTKGGRRCPAFQGCLTDDGGTASCATHC